MHALEDTHKLMVIERQRNRDIVHLALAICLIPLKILDDPETTIRLLLVGLLDQFLTVVVIKRAGSCICLTVGPVEHFLVNTLALIELVIKGFEVCIRLTSQPVDRLAALHLHAH